MHPPSWFVALALLAGCSDPYTVEEYWNDLAEAHCARMRDCCTPGEYVDWWTDSVATQDCQRVWEDPPGSLEVRQALHAGHMTFDPAAAHACLDALGAQACGDFEPAYRYHESYCEAPLRGTLADGARCDVGAECASTWCAFASGNGTCMPTVGHGEACGNGVGCTLPDTCRGGTCGLGLAAGASCHTDLDCIDHWCQGRGLFTPGTCVRACDGFASARSERAPG